MRKRGFLRALILCAWVVGMLCLTGTAAEAEHEHTPDQIWWLDDENQHWQTCAECGERVLVGDHEWSVRMVEKAGSCTEDRVEVVVCDVCQRNVRRVTPAPGHVWDEGAVAEASTCGEPGVFQYTCTACGETRTEELPLAAHQPGEAWDSGSSQHWHICLVCGEKTDISYHNWTNWITGVSGTQTRSCKTCGRVESRKYTGAVAPDLVVVSSVGTVQKSFVREGQGFAVCGSTEGLSIESRSMNFTDVHPNAWYYNDVQFAASHELLVGLSPTIFGPQQNMTRAMLAAVIYRLEGSPAACGSGAFADVPAGKWYTDAVNWAAEHGIIYGISEREYAPDAPVTREQMVAILYRYAQYLGMDTTARASLQGFLDSGAIYGYAVVPMQWSVATGLIYGREDASIAPKATATRAEVAAILQRMTVRVTEELGTGIC